jgi:hypothetical protein
VAGAVWVAGVRSVGGCVDCDACGWLDLIAVKVGPRNGWPLR